MVGEADVDNQAYGGRTHTSAEACSARIAGRI